MELLDYTGELNEHNKYLTVIKYLENKSKYLEYVIIDKDDQKLVEEFANLIISEKLKNKWWGTKSSGKNKVYRLNVSKEIFKYLRNFETFCRLTSSNQGDIVKETNFGINDIAFFDDEDLPLLYTTTHEGYITIRDDLFK